MSVSKRKKQIQLGKTGNNLIIGGNMIDEIYNRFLELDLIYSLISLVVIWGCYKFFAWLNKKGKHEERRKDYENRNKV